MFRYLCCLALSSLLACQRAIYAARERLSGYWSWFQVETRDIVRLGRSADRMASQTVNCLVPRRSRSRSAVAVSSSKAGRVDGAGGGLADRKTRTRPNTGQTTHVRIDYTVTAYENRIAVDTIGYTVRWSIGRATTTYANAPPSAATRERVARPVRTPRLLAF